MNVRDDLVQRWLDLMKRTCAKCDSVEKFHAIEKAYGAAHRHYHTFEHIRACLDELEAARALAGDYDAIELAIWFHDFVYDPYRSDNENASANYAFAFCASTGLVRHAQSVEQMIRATNYADILAASLVRHRADTDLLLDIDLSILGQPEAVFDRYEMNIRREYARAPTTLFNETRMKVLEMFLKRPFIYRTEFFRKKYEVKARENIEHSIILLTDSIDA